jgi:hypothetical protein
MDILKQLSDGISAFLSLIGILLLGYMLLMGMARKAGKTKWYRIEQDRRILQGKANIGILSVGEEFELPWKDPSLIQGGFKALGIVGILLSYVAIMVAFMVTVTDDNRMSLNEVLTLVRVLMTWPVSMGVYVVQSKSNELSP